MPQKEPHGVEHREAPSRVATRSLPAVTEVYCQPKSIHPFDLSIHTPMPAQRRTRQSNRPHRDWVKGERKRQRNVDADDERVGTGHEAMRPREIAIASQTAEGVGGEVIQVRSGQYHVQLRDSGTTLVCRTKRGITTDNSNTTLVAIGDHVRVRPTNDTEGMILHVAERATWLGRKGAGQRSTEQVIAANADLLLCIVAADRPDFRRTIIDRFIVAALLGKLHPVIVVNKIDTANPEIREILADEVAVYPTLGYPVLHLSAESGEGMELLQELIAKNRSTAVLAGQSGVGKSTLMNRLIGGELRRTAEVRHNDRRGVHTTVDSVLHLLPTGGRLIDTPGIREFGIWDLQPEELDGYFTEFLEHLRNCRYLPCTHTHEPNCAVRNAVESGMIDPGRYASYLSIFDSLR